MTNKWSIDFASLDPSRGRSQVAVQDPPGFALSSSQTHTKGNLKGKKDAPPTTDQETLKVKKAWEAAFSPGKSIPMNAFMLWMSGSGVTIFSVMITGMLFFSPIKALMGVDSVFERYESPKNKRQLLVPKMVYILLQLCTMGLGLYKCSSMGLLPTATSDWLAFMEPKTVTEYSIF
ncbi:1722_t:CDS:2 [Paraglomus occultum]|uniref:ER membrane protein complex subunit 4 n=1 Tax=Paraglomus occultum TaxID=144539 RepID=A0A9N9C5P7_9GLOM|nr:1722_t:CDS:2 [Paraglomus occultum]